MNTITNYILLLLLITSFSSFGQVMEDAMEAAAEEAYGPNDQVPADIFFGNESDPNFVKFITPSGSITVYFPEVLMEDEGDAYSVHFPLFGGAPVIPDYLDITVEEVFRRGSTGGLMRLSLSFNEQKDYKFLRDNFVISLFKCHQDFSAFYISGIIADDLSDMTHTLEKVGNEYVFNYNSTLIEDDAYQLVLHVEAKPSPLIVNDKNAKLLKNVYYFPDMALLAYQPEYPGLGSFIGQDEFIPLPVEGTSRSGYFDPESYRLYEFESLSEQDITFNIYNVKSWEGESRYDQVILEPLEDADPDISEITLTEDMLQETIEATTIYTIKAPPLLIDYNDLSEALQYCTYPREYKEPKRIIGSNELPTSQSLAVNPENFKSFKLINNRLEGLSFSVEGNTITQRKTNIEDLVAKARYQSLKDNAGKQADKLFDFIYDMYENRREMVNKPLEWWKSKAKELKVKEIDGDDPQSYAEGIMGFYEVDRDMAELIIYTKQLGKEGKEVSANPVQTKYSDRFRVDLTIDEQGNLVTASHHRPGAGSDIAISFTYEGNQMIVELAEEEGESFKRTLAGMEGLIDYNIILAALPAMKLKSGYQNELYLTNYRATTFGGDHSIKPIFNKVAMEVSGEETIDFLNEQVSTYKLELKFMIRPQNPTVSTIYEAMFLPDGSNLYQLNVWISKKDNMPIRLQTNGGSYWLFREGQDIKKWDQWMSNNNPDPFGL